MTRIVIILLFITSSSFAQSNEKFLTDFLPGSELKSENVRDKYNHFDFSNIWSQTENNNVLGIFGKDYQRLKIKLISIKKDQTNPNEYFVFGKSCVKGTICDFNGKITLTEIKEVKELHFGVDDEYADKGIKSQGILIADYEFKENPEKKQSGIFEGKLHSKWYLNSKSQIEYDNIEFISDGYTNNAFVGIWKSYTTEKVKICNWADYRVPNSNQDFDIGVGEFNVSEKYWDKGWLDITLKNQVPNHAIKKSKPEKTKEWWE